MKLRKAIWFTVAVALSASFIEAASAHCDSLDGPVVRDARSALDGGDPTPVLKWVRQEHEPEIRAAFDRALAVRALGVDANAIGSLGDALEREELALAVVDRVWVVSCVHVVVLEGQCARLFKGLRYRATLAKRTEATKKAKSAPPQNVLTYERRNPRRSRHRP